MTALAADKQVKTRKADISRYPAEEAKLFYKGAMVCINADGRAVPAAKTAGFGPVVGLAAYQVDNSAGADDAVDVSVESGFIAYLTTVSGAQALVGNAAFAIDDQTVGGVASAGVTSLSPYVGRFVEYISSTLMGVFIPTGPGSAGAGGTTGEIEVGLVAGGAAGDHTLTGISIGDRIVWVGHLSTAAAIATLADITAEFSVTAADTINNAAGTDTTNDQLMVIYEKRS